MNIYLHPATDVQSHHGNRDESLCLVLGHWRSVKWNEHENKKNVRETPDGQEVTFIAWRKRRHFTHGKLPACCAGSKYFHEAFLKLFQVKKGQLPFAVQTVGRSSKRAVIFLQFNSVIPIERMIEWIRRFSQGTQILLLSFLSPFPSTVLFSFRISYAKFFPTTCLISCCFFFMKSTVSLNYFAMLFWG